MKAMILLVPFLTGCAMAPRYPNYPVSVEYTATGPVIHGAQPLPWPPRYHDGSLIPEAELDRMGLEAPRLQPVWACMSADLGTTAVGLSMGFSEANPLGIYALPVGIASAVMARKAELQGDPLAAKVVARIHCAAAIWNFVSILLVL